MNEIILIRLGSLWFDVMHTEYLQTERIEVRASVTGITNEMDSPALDGIACARLKGVLRSIEREGESYSGMTGPYSYRSILSTRGTSRTNLAPSLRLSRAPRILQTNGSRRE